MNVFKAEFKKTKRSFANKLIWIVPCLFTVFSFLVSLLTGGRTKENYVVAAAYNWYPLFILPMVICLLVSGSMNLEYKNNTFTYLKSHNIEFSKIILIKSMVVAFQLFSITAISFVLLYVVNIFFTASPVSFINLLCASGSIYMLFTINTISFHTIKILQYFCTNCL